MLQSDRCSRCYGRGESCLCSRITPVETRTRFLVLRHSLEWNKQSNTARVAALALTNCELRAYGAKDRPNELEGLELPGTFLLFPEGPPWIGGEPPRQLVVLDGSWSQARRMLQRIEPLRQLPRLSLRPREGRRSLRSAPAGGMSTLEAIAGAVALLEGQGAAAPLEALHQAMVDRVLRSRGYL